MTAVFSGWRTATCVTFITVFLLSSCQAQAPGQKLTCFQCQNYKDGKYYDICPANGTVNPQLAYSDTCDGKCFTRTFQDDEDLVVRGCTAGFPAMPNPLPADGCYDYQGATICICSAYYCNAQVMQESSGVAFEEHLSDPDFTIPVDPSLPLQCWQCVNYDIEGKYYAQCPKDTPVVSHLAYSDNCTEKCFTRSDKDDPLYVARGCTASQYGMPDPLPADGCYDHKGEVWCICNSSYCNGKPLGQSFGKRMDDHLVNLGDDFEEPDGIFKCYQCTAIDIEGNYYYQCPKYDRVTNAYLAPCNGSCITRSYDDDDRQVGRGCSDNQGLIPDPLPPDGCYKYYLDVWCVCSTSRCNGAALGEPMDVEFDDHLKSNEGDDASIPKASCVILSLGVITMTAVSFVML